MLRKIAGGLMLLLGVALIGWVGFNLFIEMQPEAQEHSAIPPLLVSAGLIFVGQKWIRQKRENASA